MSRTMPRQEALLSRPRAGERGAISASLIILPMVLLTILVTIQLALVMHGRNVAAAAAQDGLHAAQLLGSTEGNGVEAAERTLELFEGISSADITVTKTQNTVTIRVQGEVAVPVDGLFNSFDVTVTGPTERFYKETERQ